jgi:hypothetical protein
MAAKRKPAANGRADPKVDDLLRTLDHPLARELATLRRLILATAPDVREEVKWNAPSFKTTDHFATVNVRGRDRLLLVLHAGAKAKSVAKSGLRIDDPDELLEWRGKDRAVVTLRGGADFTARVPALRAVLAQWVKATRGL